MMNEGEKEDDVLVSILVLVDAALRRTGGTKTMKEVRMFQSLF